MSKKPLAIIRIKIQTRSDETVYISSGDMPGLWLWGRIMIKCSGASHPPSKSFTSLMKVGQ